jgi:hypothetical protein
MNETKQKKTSHLTKVNKSYFKHLKGAMRTSRECLVVSLAALVHGFFPFLFETTASDAIRKIYKRQN